jgi:hypothetical protein
MWRIREFGSSLGGVRSLLLVFSLTWLAGLAGCRILHSGLSGDAGAADTRDLAAVIGNPTDSIDAQGAIDLGEPPGVPGAPDISGCSDGTREGFRGDPKWPEIWPDIAGCAGAFDRRGVIGSPELQPSCELLAGDTNSNSEGNGCTAADLCAANWHVCRNGDDVAKHSPTGDCEGSVPAGEPRFFLVASGASPMGICSADPQAVNDLHGCGGLGQPEDQTCAPLSRRMGFADCMATSGVWNCGTQDDSLREAEVVSKTGTTLGGVLCCRN